MSHPYRIKPGTRVRLNHYDPDDTALLPEKAMAKRKSMRQQKRLAELQELLFAEHRHKVLIVLQGMDTSGKDGTIRHVMDGFNPQGVHVFSFRKPSEEELDHDYLWRAHARVPPDGGIVVFNRSHYEDVLIVRVHGLVPEESWRQRYRQIVDFERMLSENGTLILKFFLHISKDEQRRRLQERVDDPTKRWKFQHSDVKERKYWHEYRLAYEDALAKTSTECAPWYIVPANVKWYRNYVIGSVITEALEGLDMKYPEPDLSEEVIK
jgi:PPK2 family polyphosphate:nucleotide phosphotransferase